jgi:hypothetical protein
MEDVEVGTLTQLAEIMLHPPTEIVNGRYFWREEVEGKGKAMGDNDDVGIDCDSGGDEEVGGGPMMMMMMTSSPPSDGKTHLLQHDNQLNTIRCTQSSRDSGGGWK